MVKRSGPNEMVWKDVGLEAPIIEEMFGGGNPDRTVLTLPLGIVNPPIGGFGGFKRKTSEKIYEVMT